MKVPVEDQGGIRMHSGSFMRITNMSVTTQGPMRSFPKDMQSLYDMLTF